MSSIPAMSSPPRATLAFRVGVVGHRPKRLKHADLRVLENLIHTVLKTVQDHLRKFLWDSSNSELYEEEPPVLRAISPLAEGADRIFAREAIRLGYELCCPMPFPQSEYEEDFDKTSRDEFRQLLADASKTGLTTFELDGAREHEDAAYQAAGRIVLNQSDLLVAVWDRKRRAGRGGTLDTLREAIRYHVPVLWIDAVRPHPWRMLSSDADIDALEIGPDDERRSPPIEAGLSLEEALEQVVLKEVTPPPKPKDAKKEDTGVPQERDYFEECLPKFRMAVLWKVFRNTVGAELWASSAAEDEADSSESSPNRSVADPLLQIHYEWADTLANIYGNAYRSTYLFIYFSAAFAVFLALLPMAFGWTVGDEYHLHRTLCVAGEFLTLSSITVLLLWALHRDWHKRWISYRLLAELVRQLRCLVPLGGGDPLARLPAHLAISSLPAHLATYGNLSSTWMYWQLRAIARAAGIPTVSADVSFVKQRLDYLDEIVRGKDGQLKFHQVNADRSTRITHRLHRFSVYLFILTTIGIITHLLPVLGIDEWSAAVDRWLTLLSATLPALAAAAAGINNQGEFARIAKRSRSMSKAFEDLGEQIDELKEADSPLRIEQVTLLAGKVTQLMVDEVVDWRVVFIDRPANAA